MTFHLKSGSHLTLTRLQTIYFYPSHSTLALKFPILQMASLFLLFLSLNPESSLIFFYSLQTNSKKNRLFLWLHSILGHLTLRHGVTEWDDWATDHTRIHTHTHMHTHTCTHKHTHAHTCTHAHAHKHTHAHTCTHTETHTHARTHRHTHARTHTRTHSLSLCYSSSGSECHDPYRILQMVIPPRLLWLPYLLLWSILQPAGKNPFQKDLK